MAEIRACEIKNGLLTRIKLCGLRRTIDIEYANELLPEYIGFVFAKGSKRYVNPDEAKILKSKLKGDIKVVGVFVDEATENIEELIDKNIIDMVQLHGNEDENYINRLRQETNCKIIKAFRVAGCDDISKAIQSSADYVLLDSGGGSGETFDWSVIRENGIDRPYFLAGGLEAANVCRAISELKPFAVDASSSLETAGCKNIEKMRAFVQAVRRQLK